jgi:hypothetical protein
MLTEIRPVACSGGGTDDSGAQTAPTPQETRARRWTMNSEFIRLREATPFPHFPAVYEVIRTSP